MDDTTTTITPLGGDVYEIDTRMAGYRGITAGYLILGDRPCLVEPGTSGSAPVVEAARRELGVGADDLATVVVTHIHLDTTLASLEKFRALGPQRLLFAHYGPVGEVDDTLERSAEELRVWVDHVKDAKDRGLDLDHAVAMVVERTRDRYAVSRPDVDPEIAAKYEVLSSAESNVAGIMHALDRHA